MPSELNVLHTYTAAVTPHVWSLVAIPALAGIWLTALFGLNAVRSPTLREALTWPGAIDFFQGLSHLIVTFISFMMLMAAAFGGNIYTWRGSALMWGIWGMFVFVGHYQPWRRFIRRVVSMERLERKYRGKPAPSNSELSELIAKGRRAIAMPMRSRADECMRVMPYIVVALERVAARQLEIATIRAELQSALLDLRTAVARDEPTGKYVLRINSLLDRLSATLPVLNP
ncbi:holin [Xanthomonas phage NEB7]|nr:holin [Xanthomonas phage NEB7]